jgi:hypothetical protein
LLPLSVEPVTIEETSLLPGTLSEPESAGSLFPLHATKVKIRNNERTNVRIILKI